MHPYRTHTCGALSAANAGETVRLSGWAHRIRDHGGLLFVDLRDHYGLTQCVVDPDSAAFADVEKLRAEWVVRFEGEVKKRDAEAINPNLPTGEIEVFIRSVEVLGLSAELPMPVFGDQEYPEDMRLRYRFLDLRRDGLHNRIVLRSKVISSIRRRMVEQGFMEYQTPILTASSPEGARDFLVPSRLKPGKFYALPQAPQMFKQLLMISGFDRYFQIAQCFRDEDPRHDRSFEFTQLDVEMSFVEQEDVFQALEPVLRGIFEEFGNGWRVTQEFPRIPYSEAIRKYGSDKPDLRNPIEMQAVTAHFAGSDFKVFANQIASDAKVEVWAIPAPTGGSRAFCDRMNAWAQGEGQPGLGYIFWRLTELPTEAQNDPNHELALLAASQKKWFTQTFEMNAESGVKYWRQDGVGAGISQQPAGKLYWEAVGPVAKNIGIERSETIRRQLNLGGSDAVFFVLGRPEKFYKFAGEARTRVGTELKLLDVEQFAFCWIVDFPMFEWNEEEKRVDFSHNPFSMPQGGLEALASQDPLTINAYQYDSVCNGYELSSGAIRNHRPEIMRKAFEIAGYDQSVLESQFGGMLRALQFGAPPHGGIAPGIDRILMLLCHQSNLREVTAFPMNQQGEDLLLGAPSEATAKQLRELHIRVNVQDKK